MNEALTAISRNDRTKRAYPSLKETTRTWVRVALLSFGGPAGQIAVMHRILVEDARSWQAEIAELHPGPRRTRSTDSKQARDVGVRR
jgi:hypothetical protein